MNASVMIFCCIVVVLVSERACGWRHLVLGVFLQRGQWVAHYLVAVGQDARRVQQDLHHTLVVVASSNVKTGVAHLEAQGPQAQLDPPPDPDRTLTGP